MHKTRRFLSPILPRLCLAAFHRESLYVTGDFETLTRPILDATIRNAGRALDVPQDYVIAPIHELQVPHFLDKFKEASVYPEEFSVSVRAQTEPQLFTCFEQPLLVIGSPISPSL